MTTAATHHEHGNTPAGTLFVAFELGLDHGIGHFMIFEVDLEAQAPAPPIPKWLRTSSAASDRRTVLPLSSRQAG